MLQMIPTGYHQGVHRHLDLSPPFHWQHQLCFGPLPDVWSLKAMQRLLWTWRGILETSHQASACIPCFWSKLCFLLSMSLSWSLCLSDHQASSRQETFSKYSQCAMWDLAQSRIYTQYSLHSSFWDIGYDIDEVLGLPACAISFIYSHHHPG